MTTITTALPSTGFEQPSGREVLALLKIVLGAYPNLRGEAETRDFNTEFGRTFFAAGYDNLGASAARDFEMEFARAFIAVGFAYRTPQPSTSRYFHSFVEDANGLLRTYWSAKAVSGTALLAAIIAHGDVAWRPANRAVGQLLEVGLDPYSGIRCSNAWKGVLEGRPLKAPLAPRRMFRDMAAPSPMRVFRQERPGEAFVDVSGSRDPLWR